MTQDTIRENDTCCQQNRKWNFYLPYKLTFWHMAAVGKKTPFENWVSILSSLCSLQWVCLYLNAGAHQFLSTYTKDWHLRMKQLSCWSTNLCNPCTCTLKIVFIWYAMLNLIGTAIMEKLFSFTPFPSVTNVTLRKLQKLQLCEKCHCEVFSHAAKFQKSLI